MFAQNITQESMFREAIQAELKLKKIPARRVARELDFNYNAFNEFLNGTQETFPIQKIEKVFAYLHLEIKPQSDPPGN
jgi:hypothetical protein